MKNYADIFNHRGNDYDAAMRNYPKARDEEFLQLFKDIDISGFTRVLDCPAGGGYLQKYLPVGCEISALDPSDGFLAKSASVLKVDFQHLEFPENYFDAAVCLAALHHIEPKAPFLSSMARSVAPGGYLFVADVLKNSKESIFLDEFVGLYNQTGHEGSFLIEDSGYLNQLTGQEAELIRYQYLPCAWRFDSESESTLFCRQLFGMSGISDADLLAALKSYIGFRHDEGRVLLDWSLLYATYKRKIPAT
jgi:SAM-dependent methyltransferase